MKLILYALLMGTMLVSGCAAKRTSPAVKATSPKRYAITITRLTCLKLSAGDAGLGDEVFLRSNLVGKIGDTYAYSRVPSYVNYSNRYEFDKDFQIGVWESDPWPNNDDVIGSRILKPGARGPLEFGDENKGIYRLEFVIETLRR